MSPEGGSTAQAAAAAGPSAVPHVRPARDADGDGVGRLMAAVFADYPHCFYIADEFPELAAFASHYARQDGAAFIAEAAGAVVGSLAVCRSSDPETFELHTVYLAHAARGRGLAREMLARAEAVARAGGGRRLRLWSDTRFAEGHAFYRRNGFRQVPAVRFLNDVSLTWEYAFDKPLTDRAGAR